MLQALSHSQYTRKDLQAVQRGKSPEVSDSHQPAYIAQTLSRKPAHTAVVANTDRK